MAASLHRHVYWDPLPRQRGESCVSEVVKLKFFDIRFLASLLYLRVDVALGDACPVVQGEDVSLDIGDDGTASLFSPDLLIDLSRSRRQRRDLLDLGLLSPALGLDDAVPFVDHAISESKEIALR